MSDGSSKLAEQILCHQLRLTVLLALVLQLFSLGMVFLQVLLHEVESLLILNISFLFEVPGRYLAKVSHLKNQIQIVMVVIVDHLVKLGNVWMVQLGPQLDLIVDLVKIIYHLHLALGIVPDGSFPFQGGLVHHLHGKFSHILHIIHAHYVIILHITIIVFLFLLFLIGAILFLAILFLLLLLSLQFLSLVKLLEL